MMIGNNAQNNKIYIFFGIFGSSYILPQWNLLKINVNIEYVKEQFQTCTNVKYEYIYQGY